MSDKSPYTDHLESVDQFGQVVPLFPNPEAGEVEQAVPENKFHSELRDLVNRHSKEAGSNTPDFVLAEYLDMALKAFDYCVRYRESYYATPAPAGEVEELDLRIALGRIFGGELPAEPGPLRAQQHERWTNQILALFTASQPPVVEGELDIREILDALVAREHGADNDMTVEKAEQLLAARQQSADEVRRELQAWNDMEIIPEPYAPVLARCEWASGKVVYAVLQVNADDEWRTADDNSELDYSLNVTHWREIPELTQRGEGGGK